MLDKRRCPHTGIVNYFVPDEPRFAVACVYERRDGLVWLCHLSETRGRATSIAEAELAVRDALATASDRLCSLTSDRRGVDGTQHPVA